jgi:23S rRNA (pseudouridine1915-N3)-methyltransferase
VKITILAVGKVKERGIREAIDDYLGRSRRHFPIEEVEVRDAPFPQLAAVLEKRLPPGAHAVALDVAGTARTSEQFARWLDAKAAQGKGNVVFLIGGADGLPPALVARAPEKLSLSAMTFPHRLARLVLAEQLYRAVTILRNEPYARL